MFIFMFVCTWFLSVCLCEYVQLWEVPTEARRGGQELQAIEFLSLHPRHRAWEQDSGPPLEPEALLLEPEALLLNL